MQGFDGKWLRGLEKDVVNGIGQASRKRTCLFRFTGYSRRNIISAVIRSFRCDETKAIFERTGSKRFRSIEAAAYGRLLRLHAATSLLDLAAIRGNRLEALKGDRNGQHSIRVNDRYRICFVWSAGNVEAAEIVDYHD